MPQSVADHWNALCDHLHIPRDLIATYADIVNRYREPQRHYHTLMHLRQCFTEYEWLEAHTGKPPCEKLRAAIFFHNIVYDPRRNDNEEQSAAFAEALLRKLGVRESFISGVNRYVLATKTHEDPEDQSVRAFLDIDLSILGQPRAVFDEYERNIRKEYAHVPDSAFFHPQKGRPAILKRFLNRPHIFFTEPFRKKYEQAARDNLIRSLACMVEG